MPRMRLPPMGRAFGPTMHYVYADRWTAALTPTAFNDPLLENLQCDDITWSQCLIKHRRDARPASPPPHLAQLLGPRCSSSKLRHVGLVEWDDASGPL